MGIKSLLPKFKNIEQDISLADLSGEIVGIDASTWLYSILAKYSIELVNKTINPKETYVKDFCSALDLLLNSNIVPVVVFDGEDLPAKQHTKEERTRRRRKAKAQALHFIALKDDLGAKIHANQAVHVDSEIVHEVMQALDHRGIHWVQAPYEADAQLAYMANVGVIHYVISTDSDLLVYGTPRVIYKWNIHNGTGLLIRFADLHKCLKFKFSLERFQSFCVITGCDYLSSIRGIGPHLAEKFMGAIDDKDIFQEIPHLGTHIGRRTLEVPLAYPDNVKKALFIFQHQAVYDFGLNDIVSFTQLDMPQPAEYTAAAGLTSRRVPPCSGSLKLIWISPQDLNISSLSDISWKADESDLGDRNEPPATRSGLTITVIAGETERMVWTPPCLQVLRVPLFLGQDSNHQAVAVHLNDNPDLPQVPFTLHATESCNISVNQQDRLLLWKWTILMNEADLKSDDEEEQDLTEDDSESEEEVGDDIVILDDDDENEELNEGEHTLNFKVVGVTYKGRQNFIECAKELMANGVEVPASLIPEPQNPVDPGGIAVFLDTGVAQFGNVCVGYIPKEFKECVTKYLNDNLITKVKVHHIKLQTHFNPIGLYILLKISKKGRWPNFVVRKSMHAR